VERHPAAPREEGAPANASRLDWRFLLADLTLDRVGCLGRQEGGPLVPLRSLARTVDVLEPVTGRRGEVEAYDAVIACDPSKGELEWAAEQVKPGGALVVETRGPALARWGGRRARRRAPGPHRTARRLSQLGFEDIRSYWHWPSVDRCTRIVPLDDPTALRYGLSRGGGGAKGRAAAWLGRGLQRAGLLGLVVGSASVIGRRSRNPRSSGPGAVDRMAGARRRQRRSVPRGLTVVHDFLGSLGDRPELGLSSGSRGLSFVVLTPRFQNSSHLIFLLLPPGRSEAVLVAKVPREPGRCTKVEREAEVLGEIHAVRPTGFETIPRPIAFEVFAGRTILLETAMPGRAMDRATVRSRTTRCCEATLAWLIELQTATRRAPSPASDGFERLVERELLAAERWLPDQGRLIERTRELVLPLSRADLSLVLEHGDLGHPNLLVGPEGRVSVIDWELAELRGLPASDLFFFLAYVSRALEGARSSESTVAALDRAFFGRRSWARSFVVRYARRLELPVEALTPLFVACWVRQLTGLARRVANEGEGGEMAGSGMAAWLGRDWRLAAWRHAVEQSSRLDWGDVP
jgi:aminoglycoside phosphotransferase